MVLISSSRIATPTTKMANQARKGTSVWCCHIRNKEVSCLASVIQSGNTFKREAQPQKCQPKDCALPVARIKAQLRQEGKACPYASGATLVKEAIQQHLPPDAPATSMPTVSALVRSTNFIRQTRRPTHPKDLEFEWVESAIPSNFIQKDIRVGTARHIIMFTALLLTLLGRANGM